MCVILAIYTYIVFCEGGTKDFSAIKHPAVLYEAKQCCIVLSTIPLMLYYTYSPPHHALTITYFVNMYVYLSLCLYFLSCFVFAHL